MVLTNFECWANTTNSELTTNPMCNTTKLLSTASNNKNIPCFYHNQNVIDLFNPRVVRDCSNCEKMIYNKNQLLSMNTDSSNIGNSSNSDSFNFDHNNNRNVSHLSSNGYYGFAPLSMTTSSSTLDTQQQRISSDAKDVMDTTITPAAARGTPMTMQNFQNTKRVHMNMNSSPMENYKNYCSERRKRYLAQDNDDNMMNNHYQNVKRFRSCSQQQNFYENQAHLSSMFDSANDNNNNTDNVNMMMEFENVNDYTKMFSTTVTTSSPSSSSSLMMDSNHPFQNVNNSMTINATATPSNNLIAARNSSSSNASLKSNFDNTKYMDINRCMTSHMI